MLQTRRSNRSLRCNIGVVNANQRAPPIMISTEQANKAKEIVLDTLDEHNPQNVRFSQVWTNPSEDFDGVPFVDVVLVYDGEPSDIDARIANSYDGYLFEVLRKAGIHAIPCVDYITQSDIDQNGAPWTG